jgi:hypothetical protein
MNKCLDAEGNVDGDSSFLDGNFKPLPSWQGAIDGGSGGGGGGGGGGYGAGPRSPASQERHDIELAQSLSRQESNPQHQQQQQQQQQASASHQGLGMVGGASGEVVGGAGRGGGARQVLQTDEELARMLSLAELNPVRCSLLNRGGAA